MASGFAAIALLATTAISIVYAISESVNAERADRDATSLRIKQRDLEAALTEADRQTKEAKRQEGIAKDNATEATRQLSRYCIERGVQADRQGKLFEALLWFAEPLVRARLSQAEEAKARLRLAGFYQHSLRPTLAQIVFHAGAVRSVAFSFDDHYFATASSDKTARVWDSFTGEATTPPLVHELPVDQVTFHPSGKTVLSVSGQTVWVWDARTGDRIVGPINHDVPVSQATFSPDGRYLVTVTGKTVHIWTTATGFASPKTLRHGGTVTWAEFSPDSTQLATANELADEFGQPVGGELHLWQTATGRSKSPSTKHRTPVRVVRFSPNGRLMVSVSGGLIKSIDPVTSEEETIQIWDLRTNKPLKSIKHSDGHVALAAFNMDGTHIVTHHGASGPLEAWEIRSGQQIKDTRARHGEVDLTPFLPRDRSARAGSIALSPDGRRLLISCSTINDVLTGEQIFSIPCLDREANRCAAFSSDCRRVIVGSADGAARVWELVRKYPLPTSLLWDANVLDAAYSPDGTVIATAGRHDATRLWDGLTGRPLTPPFPERVSGGMRRVVFSPDGHRVATLTNLIPLDGEGTHGMEVWDARTGKSISGFVELAVEGGGVRFSADSAYLLMIRGHSVEVWDATNGKPLSLPLKHDAEIRDAIFSSDGTRVITLEGTTLRSWDAATGRLVDARKLPVTGTIASIALSQNGGHLVTSVTTGISSALDEPAGGEIQVWDTRSMQPLGPPYHQSMQAAFVEFSADGHRFIATNASGLRVFDTVSCRPLTATLDAPSGEFSPDGRRIVAISGEEFTRVGGVRIWDAETGQPLTCLLDHKRPVSKAIFSPDGNHLLALSGDPARMWNLTPPERSTQDWLQLLRFLSGHQLDDTGEFEALLPQELATTWKTVKARYPQEFGVTSSEAAAWHRDEAESCSRESNYRGVLFHLDLLRHFQLSAREQEEAEKLREWASFLLNEQSRQPRP